MSDGSMQYDYRILCPLCDGTMLVKGKENHCESCGFIRRPIMEFTECCKLGEEPMFVPPKTRLPHP